MKNKTSNVIENTKKWDNLYRILIVLIALAFFSQSLFAQTNKNDVLNGYWISTANNFKVKAYNTNDVVYAKLVSFPCNHKIKVPLSAHLDDLNPDKKLRSRSWVGLLILQDLKYAGNNKWTGGSVYNPHDGRTWSASVSLINDNQLIVRGYWGIELIGKSLYFKRETPLTVKPTLK